MSVDLSTMPGLKLLRALATQDPVDDQGRLAAHDAETCLIHQ